MDAGIVVVTHEGASQQNTMYDIEAFNNTEYGAFIMDNLAEAMGEEGVYTTMSATSPTPPTTNGQTAPSPTRRRSTPR